MKRTLLSLIGACLLLLGANSHAASARKDVMLPGDAQCTRCHGEDDTSPVLVMGQTKHGLMSDKRLPGCIGCHGESPTHAKKPEDATTRPAPDFPYGKKIAGKVSEHNALCTTCHKGGSFMQWQGSSHSARDVACSNCHSMHAAKDKVRERLTQPEVCFSCHKEQRQLAKKPSHHPITEGKVICSDCHAAHGSAGPKLMVRDSVADTCFSCHAEKRGPFIRKHEPAEDCTICHNPHGTAADNLLKMRPPMLCQQCHEPSSHQGNIPGLGAPVAGVAMSNKNITQGRACLNCHTQIHGSNNPANAGNERTFRR